MVSAIIVAGGKGLRLGNDIPKQFLQIKSKPILMHTIEALHYHPDISEVIVVLPLTFLGYWKELCREHSFEIKHKISTGGESRYHSVKNGLLRVSQDSQYIMVHDAVRPFVSKPLIDRLIEQVKISGTAIPVVESVDSLRMLTGDNNSRYIDRSSIKRVQTPQIFGKKILNEAYENLFSEGYTDDASVVESLGHKISLVLGEPSNIKITTKVDMLIAEHIEIE